MLVLKLVSQPICIVAPTKLLLLLLLELRLLGELLVLWQLRIWEPLWRERLLRLLVTTLLLLWLLLPVELLVHRIRGWGVVGVSSGVHCSKNYSFAGRELAQGNWNL
jgi:hypothetical protein